MTEIKKDFKNFIKCICTKCPSHNLCAKIKFQKVFCAGNSKNSCISEKRGCICADCPVYKDNSLDRLYYCIGKGE